MARALERFPCALEEQALLGVNRLRLTGAVAEELGVEKLDPVERRACVHERRIVLCRRVDAVGPELVLVERPHGLDAVAEVPPERLDVRRGREAAAHADDGDVAPAAHGASNPGAGSAGIDAAVR